MWVGSLWFHGGAPYSIGTMTTYPIRNPAGVMFAVEVENAYVTPSAIGDVIRDVDGVSSVEIRKLFSRKSVTHGSFRFRGGEYMINEPFGDNSRYWIGPRKSESSDTDISMVEEKLRLFRPSRVAKALGDLVTLRWASLFRS